MGGARPVYFEQRARVRGTVRRARGAGFFPKEWLDDFYQDGARLAGHATHVGVPGVEVSTGSLGHGLPIACGMALAGKRDAKRLPRVRDC